jgi:hypothetical protein
LTVDPLYFLKTYSSFPDTKSAIIKSTFAVSSGDAGFSLCFGHSGNISGFRSGNYFVGKSGYIFDQNNNFFGGYKKNEILSLDYHFHSGQSASFFFKDKLIANNLNTPIDTLNIIEFEEQPDNFASFNLFFTPEIIPAITNQILYNGNPILFNGDYILF